MISDQYETTWESLFTSIRRNFSRRKKATGITPDEPTELENLLDMIIASEESGEADFSKHREQLAKNVTTIGLKRKMLD